MSPGCSGAVSAGCSGVVSAGCSGAVSAGCSCAVSAGCSECGLSAGCSSAVSAGCSRCAWQSTRLGCMRMADCMAWTHVHGRAHGWDACAWQIARRGCMCMAQHTVWMHVHGMSTVLTIPCLVLSMWHAGTGSALSMATTLYRTSLTMPCTDTSSSSSRAVTSSATRRHTRGVAKACATRSMLGEHATYPHKHQGMQITSHLKQVLHCSRRLTVQSPPPPATPLCRHCNAVANCLSDCSMVYGYCLICKLHARCGTCCID